MVSSPGRKRELLDAVKEDPEVSFRSLMTKLGSAHSTLHSRLKALGCRKELQQAVKGQDELLYTYSTKTFGSYG